MQSFRLVSSVGFLLGLAACGLYELPSGQNHATAGTGGGSPTAGTGGAGSSATSSTQGTGGTTASSTSSTSAATGGAPTTTAGSAGSSTTGGGTGPGGSTGAGGAAGSNTLDASTPDSPIEAGLADSADSSRLTCAGRALQLEGIGYLQVSRMVADDFTLEAWIKTTTSYTGTNFYEGNGLIYADIGGVANDFGTSILSSKFAFGVGNPDTTIVSTTDVTTGQWVHVAATRRKSTGEIQVLVNGQVESSRTVAQTVSLTASSLLTIGANSVDGKYFNGLVDEVRIWNVVRSPTEIASTLHKTLMGNEPGLVAYYRLDESSGTAAADSSSSVNTATLSGEGIWIVSDAPTCP